MRQHIRAGRAIGLAASAFIAIAYAPSAHAQSETATNWTGFYAGVHLGGIWGDNTMHLVPGGYDTVFAPGSKTQTGISPSGFTGGGLAGFNFQFFSPLVLGGEAEIGGSTASATATTISTPGWPAKNKLTEDWNARFRARLGLAAGQLMPFVAAGVSMTGADLNLTFPCSGLVYKASSGKTLTGYNVGGGIDYAVTGNISTRLEYIFDDYGSPNFSTPKPYWNDRKFSSFKNNTVRVAVSYRF